VVLRIINVLPWWLQRIVSNSRLLSVLIGNYYWGLDSLDKKVIRKLNGGAGYFVELGANDGISQSNTKHLEMWRNWSGVLIEPSPLNFEKLLKTRKKSNYFVNAACVGFDFANLTVKLRYSNLMTTPLEGKSDILGKHDHADIGRKYLRKGEQVHDFEIDAKTLTSILDKAKAPNVIDFMSLDVEGGELEVLYGVDHEKYRFSWILVESRSPEALTEYMRSFGYELDSKLNSHDYLYFDSSRE
jgi:FkbM family methyltransferase